MMNRLAQAVNQNLREVDKLKEDSVHIGED